MEIEALINKAVKLINAVNGIDLESVAAHQVEAVAHLNAVLADLNGQGNESLQNDQQHRELAKDQLARHALILSSLKQEGFDSRLGRVYDSASDHRSMAFRQVPHRRQLPAFDMVVAADYAPSAGLHGVFIDSSRVYCAMLAIPMEQNSWQVLKSRPYQSVDEM